MAQDDEQYAILSQLARQLGLTTRYGIEGAASLANIFTEPVRQYVTDPVVSAVSGRPALSDVVAGNRAPRSESLTEGASRLADYIGLPKPRGRLEEGVANASRGLVGTGLTAGAGLAAGYPLLAAQPLMQGIGTINGSAAQDLAKEMGAGPFGQVVAGAIGGMTPSRPSGSRSSMQNPANNEYALLANPNSSAARRVDYDADELYAAREIPEGFYVHGRNGRQDLDTGDVIQLSRDWDIADQYAGRNGSKWLISPAENGNVLDLSSTNTKDMDEVISQAIKAWEKDSLPFLDDIEGSIGREATADDIADAVRSQFAPDDIVDSARAYDADNWKEWLGEIFDYPFVHTPDGGVVFDRANAVIKRVNEK